ncbi:hypothetical protein [Mucilaginibacter ginsenosidivorans]|uniref:TerB family tellurite resistance protein n=1 Tax=Mucilaginibacter ginsenosidivorans TaxID=398053 RepID=A0A5B8UTL5_9SPHI|nr:hypothetical protein [Mucilaginibacter ginsenosidivorans]QEC62450.1 hypothetical protein FRZ54_07565 [Mucilaginibacter ginsenosidivorans]
MASIKKLVLSALLSALSLQLFAQSFSFGDLFNQAAKQKQYYLQQIAAYQVFQSELKMGYNVMRHGLNGIAAINTAELNAHDAYYQSLRQPGTAIKNSTQVQDIIQWQAEIISSFSQPFIGLTANEQTYISLVQTNLLKDCGEDMADLQNLLRAGTLQMTDDERFRWLTRLHADMQDKYQFTQSFCGSARLLAAQRQRDTNAKQSLRNLYETN